MNAAMFNIFRYRSRLRYLLLCRQCLISVFLLCILVYATFRVKLSNDYKNAQVFYKTQQSICNNNLNQNQNRTKIILFWTKLFKRKADENYINNYFFTSSGRCGTNQCRVTNNRDELCASDAIIFHARGPINMNDMPTKRLPHQRYVLLIKEPPYKTTAIVGHLNYFFNWTATYRTDSDINYQYFYWRRKAKPTNETSQKSYLKNRQARAASMISNCYSQSNREGYLQRLNSIIPVTHVGYCSGTKCHKSREICLSQLAETHPFYLSFENSLCRDYATEKYANVIINNQMIPIVFSQTPNLYIPNSYIDANQFSSPEDLGQFLRKLTLNTTMYDSYFKWKDEYDLIIPGPDDYLCDLCKKLNNPNEPYKVYDSMKKWLYNDAKCQRWVSKLNKTIDIPVDESMDYEEPWF
ncbi:unnamed protein product [Adineta steineri]|uniref:Fucosyltransferase n=1 Tax=Adineta steineri TaxID=433720 RepID=A0A814YFK7_9BILA|nr:unnamed protein product [Adineta steineri]CAF1346297.1 unnamed protein product [Adineta steineri]CAF1570755.1 unnamed protein product [Adineta steineri]CAF1595109.1 unnamed protein product [Adineta steineri]